MAKPALGRGLGALLGGAPAAGKPPAARPTGSADGAPAPASTAAATPATAPGDRVQRLPLDRIRPCPLQPRKDFAPEALQELADSIREQGIVQPLIVRQRGDHVELIAGERRWRAARLAGLKEAPVIVREADDRDVLELALIENLQRENLNPIEEAQGYAQLTEQFKLTQEEVAARVGKSRTVVANSLRLLKLPSALQKNLRDGKLSVGHAKVLLGLPGDKLQIAAAERILKDGLNVRQTEILTAKLQARGTAAAKATVAIPLRDTHVANVESRLREVLATKVQLRYAQGKGSIEISYFSDAELERILQLLGVTIE
ncbi:MAG: ParB/RepB/Spo0J family partition protein [Verrucomicrobiota bacterium]